MLNIKRFHKDLIIKKIESVKLSRPISHHDTTSFMLHKLCVIKLQIPRWLLTHFHTWGSIKWNILLVRNFIVYANLRIKLCFILWIHLLLQKWFTTGLDKGMNPDEEIPLPVLYDGQGKSNLISDDAKKNSSSNANFTCPEAMKMSKNGTFCYAIAFWLDYKYMEYRYLRHGFISGQFSINFRFHSKWVLF